MFLYIEKGGIYADTREVHRGASKGSAKGYCEGMLNRFEIEEILGIGKTRFFALLGQYRHDPDKFSIAYQRIAHKKVPPSVEKEIKRELMIEKRLIENPTLPITTYNYSAVRDRLMKQGIEVSLPTIIDRAKSLGFYGSLALGYSGIIFFN